MSQANSLNAFASSFTPFTPSTSAKPFIPPVLSSNAPPFPHPTPTAPDQRPTGPSAPYKIINFAPDFLSTTVPGHNTDGKSYSMATMYNYGGPESTFPRPALVPDFLDPSTPECLTYISNSRHKRQTGRAQRKEAPPKDPLLLGSPQTGAAQPRQRAGVATPAGSSTPSSFKTPARGNRTSGSAQNEGTASISREENMRLSEIKRERMLRYAQLEKELNQNKTPGPSSSHSSRKRDKSSSHTPSARNMSLKLEETPGRWVPPSCDRTATPPPQTHETTQAKLDDNHDEIMKSITVMMNKLTNDNFSTLSLKIRQLLSQITTYGTFSVVSKIIFEKFIKESHFGQLYAKLTSHLSMSKDKLKQKLLKLHTKPRRIMQRSAANGTKQPTKGDIEAIQDLPIFDIITGQLLPQNDQQNGAQQWNDDDIWTFESLLVSHCYAFLAREYVNVNNLVPSDLGRHEKRELRRRYLHGDIIFLGELFQRAIVPYQTIIMCIQTVLYPMTLGTTTLNETDIECICLLLSRVGRTLDIIVDLIHDSSSDPTSIRQNNRGKDGTSSGLGVVGRQQNKTNTSNGSLTSSSSSSLQSPPFSSSPGQNAGGPVELDLTSINPAYSPEVVPIYPPGMLQGVHIPHFSPLLRAYDNKMTSTPDLQSSLFLSSPVILPEGSTPGGLMPSAEDFPILTPETFNLSNITSLSSVLQPSATVNLQQPQQSLDAPLLPSHPSRSLSLMNSDPETPRTPYSSSVFSSSGSLPPLSGDSQTTTPQYSHIDHDMAEIKPLPSLSTPSTPLISLSNHSDGAVTASQTHYTDPQHHVSRLDLIPAQFTNSSEDGSRILHSLDAPQPPLLVNTPSTALTKSQPKSVLELQQVVDGFYQKLEGVTHAGIHSTISARVRYIVLNLLELRSNNWKKIAGSHAKQFTPKWGAPLSAHSNSDQSTSSTDRDHLQNEEIPSITKPTSFLSSFLSPSASKSSNVGSTRGALHSSVTMNTRANILDTIIHEEDEDDEEDDDVDDQHLNRHTNENENSQSPLTSHDEQTIELDPGSDDNNDNPIDIMSSEYPYGFFFRLVEPSPRIDNVINGVLHDTPLVELLASLGELLLDNPLIIDLSGEDDNLANDHELILRLTGTNTADAFALEQCPPAYINLAVLWFHTQTHMLFTSLIKQVLIDVPSSRLKQALDQIQRLIETLCSPSGIQSIVEHVDPRRQEALRAVLTDSIAVALAIHGDHINHICLTIAASIVDISLDSSNALPSFHTLLDMVDTVIQPVNANSGPGAGGVSNQSTYKHTLHALVEPCYTLSDQEVLKHTHEIHNSIERLQSNIIEANATIDEILNRNGVVSDHDDGNISLQLNDQERDNILTSCLHFLNCYLPVDIPTGTISSWNITAPISDIHHFPLLSQLEIEYPCEEELYSTIQSSFTSFRKVFELFKA